MYRRSRAALPLIASAIAACVLAAGCSTTSSDSEPAKASTGTVTVSTVHGQVAVPKNPKRVVALDNTSTETLKAFGIKPVAISKSLSRNGKLDDWVNDPTIGDVGFFAEPKLEVIEDLHPDLILTSAGRWSDSEADLKKVAEKTGAALIDISPDTNAPDGYDAAMIRQTTTLGTIFDNPAGAQRIVDEFTANLNRAKSRATGQTVFQAIVNGGKIDNGGKVTGPFIAPLNLKDVFAGNAGDWHENSGLTPEAIAEADPQWLIVLDRDTAVGAATGKQAKPAADAFAAQEAFRGRAFYDKKHIFYLDPYFYLRENIQAYGGDYGRLADALANTP